MSEYYHLNPLQEDQIEDASRVLGRAFINDPLFIYCWPNLIDREIKSVLHCKWLILLGILTGKVHVTSEDIEGVAIWHPYNIEEKKLGKQPKEVIKKMQKVRKELFSDALYGERMGIIEEIANNLQKKLVNFPHWYLTMIGVDPVHKRKGNGSKLLISELAQIDKNNLSCYLHTENEKNVKYYEQFKFELIGKIKIPDSEVSLHGMLRSKKEE